MLQLFANNQQLDTAGVKFNLTLKNPMFMRDKLEGSYIFNFNLPATDRNKSILGFPERLEMYSTAQKNFNCTCVHSGITLFENETMSTNISKEGTIVANVKVFNGNTIYKNKNKYINEFDLGSRSYSSWINAITNFNSNINKSYPDVDYCLPEIVDVDYLPSGTPGFTQTSIINEYDTSGTTYLGEIICPQIFLCYLIDQLMSECGYQLSDEFFSTSETYKHLFLFNTYNADGGIPEIDDVPGYSADLTNIYFNRHVPTVLITDFILGLQNFFNISFHFKNGNVKIVDNLKTLQSANYIDLSENVTKISSIERYFKNGFSFESKPDGGDAWFSSRLELQESYLKDYGGSVELISDLPSFPFKYIHYYLEEDENFYSWVSGAWTINNDLLDLFLSKAFSGKEEINFDTIFSTLWKTPTLSEIVCQNEAKDWRDITPRLLYYKGQDTGLPDCSYSLDGKSLLVNGPYGIIKQRWKPWIDWQKTAPGVEIKRMFSPIEVKDFDFTTKTRIDRFDYLVEEIKIPINDKEIGEATMKCWKV